MSIPAKDRDQAALEAARWLVVLEDAPDDAALRAEFEAWRRADPVHAEAWAETADVYALMAEVPPVHHAQWAAGAAPHPAAAARSAPEGRRHAARAGAARGAGRPVRRRVALGAAVAAMAACLALVVAPDLLLRLESDHLTATAEARVLDLPDGSTVRLSPASAVAVDFTAAERRVRLVAGEAFFEVAPAPERPFRVIAGEATATVLGTAFNVRLAEEEVAVAVRHGRVAVTPPDAASALPKPLEAGDWVRLGPSGGVTRGAVPPDEVGVWMQGQIVARDRTIASVVDDLRRYHAGVILVADPAFGSRRVTGVYSVRDPAAALSALAGAHGGTVRALSPWVLVVTGG
ncbi:hypothetical protein C882_3604 [Caenispirillum salinarum AK4]|uniref:Uncharacterized protein n=1 Tax=Caenispirillum salinarum AK4 TaxID=1238182 RepID=K9H2N9_9PROT|nr:FecR domain-containing protein [Caenispirillum salinarum]EKV31852.1 hypothetical protein C882_3604 [Caenispirillum salinarum AK4]